MSEDDNNEEPKERRFAPTEKMDHYEHLLWEFLLDILYFEAEDVGCVFVSDGASLWDFTSYGQGPKANRAQVALWHVRVEEKYGVDVSDIEDDSLVRIFERIARTN